MEIKREIKEQRDCFKAFVILMSLMENCQSTSLKLIKCDDFGKKEVNDFINELCKAEKSLKEIGRKYIKPIRNNETLSIEQMEEMEKAYFENRKQLETPLQEVLTLISLGDLRKKDREKLMDVTKCYISENVSIDILMEEDFCDFPFMRYKDFYKEV